GSPHSQGVALGYVVAPLRGEDGRGEVPNTSRSDTPATPSPFPGKRPPPTQPIAPGPPGPMTAPHRYLVQFSPKHTPHVFTDVLVVREAPQQITDLVNWGTNFDEEDGRLALTREGGHSHRRIVHALGDATGHEVMRAIIARSQATPNLTLWADTFTLDLLTHNGACVGALVWRPGQGKLLVWAKQTILASGGAGMVYRETTNPPVATGDGMAAAYRAGALLRDMEFMQFHPTVLYVAGSSRYLISQAVRGEGAYLRDKHLDRFMLPVDPRAELAPRDIVAQAIVRCMERTKHPNVYLDLRHLDKALVKRRFPGIDKVCRGFGLDITSDLIPIRPGAHYMIGGVTVDDKGRTSVPDLWAAGEVTSTGLHGANRLASNSLLEGLVYGTSCARGAVEVAAKTLDSLTAL